MGARGRESAAELVVATDNTAEIAKRPDAPAHLTLEQKEIWRQTVDSLPADWFRKETLDVLAQYCRHVAEARDIANMLADMKASGDKFDVREYAALVRCQAGETEKINSTATKLRITLQATYDKSKKKNNQRKAPWER